MTGGGNSSPSHGETDGAESEASGEPSSPRRAPSPGGVGSERKLWQALHTLRRSHGLHFRRQVRIGGHVAAFVCQSRHVIVEVDTAPHARIDDADRDAGFMREGYRAVRLSPRRIANEWEDVLRTLEAELGLDATQGEDADDAER